MDNTDLQADLLGPHLNDYIKAQQLLLASAQHDLEQLRTLLKTVPATVREPETGRSGLHVAIASCAPEGRSDVAESVGRTEGKANGAAQVTISAEAIESSGPSTDVDRAERTLKLMLQNGAIWNDLDANDETPGCLAWRLQLPSLYEIIVEAGVRAELLLGRLDEFELLSEEEGEEDEEETTDAVEDARVVGDHEDAEVVAEPETEVDDSPTGQTQASGDASTDVPVDPSADNAVFLSSSLSFTGTKILDAAANGVMMSWETSLMQRTASLLIPRPGLKVLNIGFGMGIFDSAVQALQPSEHHIVEAHPDILAEMRAQGWDASVPSSSVTELNVETSETSTGKPKLKPKSNVTVHSGSWQTILPALVAANETFDAIFFDTFAEDYKAFREFFSESVIGLLNPGGSWSFFHGLGADRQVCYDVYTRVVEMDLFEAGFEVTWEDVLLPELGGEGGKGGNEQWEGTKRKYFSVEQYRLPLCRFVT